MNFKLPRWRSLPQAEFKINCTRNQGLAIGLAAVSGVFLVLLFSVYPPSDFRDGTRILVNKDANLDMVASMLKKEHVIRFEVVFKALARLSGRDTSIHSGPFYFEEPLSSIAILRRLSNGVRGENPVRVTIFEGTNIREIANLLSAQLPAFNRDTFLKDTEGLEGYLFPDTYFFLPGTDSQEIVDEMRANFDRKIVKAMPLISTSTKSIHDILTMASIIEEEASGKNDRNTISGILWKRISIGMPLQVDATFAYYLGKGSADLTGDDLKSDSPYNTYLNKGLPPGPITNPGLPSIMAALQPKSSSYLFYLHDKNGIARYAKTFEQHKWNKSNYLR